MARHLENLDLTWVSYADGIRVLAADKVPFVDLGLPGDNPIWATMLAATRLLQESRPALVIAREEFGVLPAAALLGIPSIFVSDWLPPPQLGFAAEALQYASKTFIFEMEGIFPVPPGLRSPPVFCGPIRRPVVRSRSRTEMRSELGLGENGKVLLVIPGGWFTESRAPIAETVLPAFRALPFGDKRLVWIGGSDALRLRTITCGSADIKVLEFVENIYDWIAASDLIITKGTRGTTMDAAALGLPSVAISFGQNLMDELIVPRIRTHTHLNSRALNYKSFGNVILALLSQPVPAPIHWADESKVAPALNAAIRELTANGTECP